MPIPRPHPKLMAIGDSLAQGCGSRILNSSRIESILPSPLETGAGCDPTCFAYNLGSGAGHGTESLRQPHQKLMEPGSLTSALAREISRLSCEETATH
jgi:hypothetical protein